MKEFHEKQIPWGEGTPWKTKSQFFTYIRGCLRRAWVRNPVKIRFILNNRVRVKNPNPKGRAKEVWGFSCEFCKKDFVLSEGQVDHKIPAGSLLDLSDLERFVDNLLFIRESDLRFLCKECHSIETYKDIQGITFEEAKLEKEVVAFKKLKAKEQIKTLNDFGVAPEKNGDLRVKQYRSIIFKED